jgi:hypothetical protein
MINFVPQSTGRGSNGSPDAALLQAMAARRKAQSDMSGGARLSAAASTTDPIYKPALGYAKLLAGGLGGYMEGQEAKAKADTAKQGASSAAAIAQSLGLTPQQAQQLQGMYLANPEAASAIVKQMSERLFAKPDAKFNDVTLPNGALAQRNAATNELSVRQEQTKPTFGDIGRNDQNGQPVKGWIDPSKQTITPAAVPGAPPAGPSNIPPVPAGVDPKIWNEEQSKRITAQGLPAAQDDVSKLRTEIQGLPSYKNLSQAAPVYTAMADAASQNSKASDLNLIYGLGKIMDPGSVVREGEMMMAKNTAGWSETLKGAVNSLNGGAALTPDTRIALMREAKGRLDAFRTSFDQDMQQYSGIVDRNRMNSADVIPQFPQATEFERAGPPVPPDLQQQIAAARQAQAQGQGAPVQAPPQQAAPQMPQGLSMDVIEAEIARRQQAQEAQRYTDPMGGQY